MVASTRVQTLFSLLAVVLLSLVVAGVAGRRHGGIYNPSAVALTQELASGGQAGGRIAKIHASHARSVVHKNVWAIIATLSVEFPGSPYANLVSYSDGVGFDKEDSTGELFFYVPVADATPINLKVNSSATVAVSSAESGPGACAMDPEDPTCCRLSLVGKVVPVPEERREYAEAVLFSKHPQMKQWPKGHEFQPYVLQIEHIVLLDFYGPAKYVSVDDYYSVKL